jgi:hypothetical protein
VDPFANTTRLETLSHPAPAQVAEIEQLTRLIGHVLVLAHGGRITQYERTHKPLQVGAHNDVGTTQLFALDLAQAESLYCLFCKFYVLND